MADFETTTDPKDCRVWVWGLKHLEHEHVEIGTELDEFMWRINEASIVIYFHNLKFDGHFIIDWLFNNEYWHTDEKTPKPGQFSTLISDMGKFYSMKICFKNGNRVEFRDSLKKLPMPVSRIAKAFGHHALKGEIDYDAPRPIGHVITAEEREYLVNDVEIVADALKTQIDKGMKKLTVGSDSLAEYKRVVGDKLFSRWFPTFPLEIDKEFRRAYRGGFASVDKRHAGHVTRGGKVYDVNSLYPSVMYYEPMPYGEPQFVKGVVEPTDSHPLTMFSITFTAKLKKDHIPCMQIKNNSMFQPTAYLSEVSEPTTIMLTNIDFALYNDHYDMKILEYGGGWRFRAQVGMFEKYIDKWSKIKAESTGGLRELAKLMLNSLYGKFASNPNVTSKYPDMVDGRVVYKRGEENTRNPVYTPVGVFITSYARNLTIRAAQEHYDVFAYADTDSLHLLTDTTPPSLDIHPHRMGAWKHEYDFDAAFYIRPKAYLERHADGTYTNRIAGLPEKISSALTFDDMVHDKVINGKLTPKSVPGGIVLTDTPFKLKLH